MSDSDDLASMAAEWRRKGDLAVAEVKKRDDSEGGALLHGAMTTPVAPQHQTDGTKSESPSDEEKALVRASANFGSLKDPFAETPGVPQSIPPASYPLRPSAFPQPTPSRPNNAFSRGANPQSAGRYRASTAANPGSVPRFRHGQNNSVAYNNGALYNNGTAHNYGGSFPNDSESDLHISQQLFVNIMTASQYVHVTPGLSSQTQTQLSRLLQDISQGVSTVTVRLRKQRDEANRAREEEHERYKRASHESDLYKKSLDELGRLNTELENTVVNVEEREKLLKSHIKDLKQQLKHTQKQLETLTADALRFHEHHDKVISDYKQQDEKHFKAITELENEVKSLRSGANNSNPDVGGFSSPTQPASEANVNPADDANYESPRYRRKGKLTEKDSAMLLDGLKKSARKSQNAEQQSKKVNFTPNPQAPAWAPTGHTPILTNAKPEQEQEDSSSGNSGDIVLYTGRGNNTGGQDVIPRDRHNTNTSMAPYRGPSGGGAPFIRTPFGIVYGEYPTVEENSRLPGDKMIPRDKEEWDVIDVQRAIAHLYDLCKGYVANCHMQSPPNVPYGKLKDDHSYTWHYLMQQVYKDPNHANNHLAYLLSTKAFIPYMLQRVCVDYMLKKILTPEVFIGFSDSKDNHLRALQTQLGAYADSRGAPNRNRQRVIEDHATLVKAIAAAPEVHEFRKRTVERHANMMSALLDPCRSKGISEQQAAKSLKIMVAACWDISIKIWSSGKTLHYVFPECATKFSPGTMEALNGHHMAGSPEGLVNSQCRVSLVVTPTMTLRDDRDAARMQCHAIHKAQVLAMK
ncbi:hypothetical protein HD806DRAFT_548658 [Xylariaceae sp. AK1471]|nr:hypothetical protein HD806DRAFT_548658 [Xylariaceae sp. AK1471]